MKILLLFSGGLDSTVLCKKLIREGHEVHLISFDYGQNHKIELEYAAKFAIRESLVHRTIDISFYGKLVNCFLTRGIGSPVVTNRNTLMTVVANTIAAEEGFDAVALGVQSGDNAVFADCRDEFFKKLADVFTASDNKNIPILTPLIDMTKQEVVNLAADLGVDVNSTYSCYEGTETPCGICVSCINRKEATPLTQKAKSSKITVLTKENE